MTRTEVGAGDKLLQEQRLWVSEVLQQAAPRISHWGKLEWGDGDGRRVLPLTVTFFFHMRRYSYTFGADDLVSIVERFIADPGHVKRHRDRLRESFPSEASSEGYRGRVTASPELLEALDWAIEQTCVGRALKNP